MKRRIPRGDEKRMQRPGRAPLQLAQIVGQIQSREEQQAGDCPGESFASDIPSLLRRRRHSGLRALTDPLEFFGDIPCRLPAVFRILRETRPYYPFESGLRRRMNGGDRRRLARHDRRDQGCLTRPRKRLATGCYLVEDGSKSEDVRPGVGFPTLELLRGHVLKGPQDCSFLRQRCFCHRRQGSQPLTPARSPGGRGKKNLRETEVEQFDARLRQHHVSGLQVPVNDSLPMRLLQRVRDLDPNLSVCSRGNGPRTSRSASVSPSRYSMTRYSTPSWLPTS